MRFRFTFLLVFLVSCSRTDLPNYWHCRGETSQVLRSPDVQELEKYSGKTMLLLEIFRGTVTQYISIPFTGVYQTCFDSPDVLTFSMGSCNDLSASKIFRKGSLDKRSGELVFSEVQANTRGNIINEGKFACAYLGHGYSADVFYAPKK